MLFKTLACATVLVAASPAVGQEATKHDPMASAYGNTITLAIAPFWSARQYIDPDGTWRQEATDGKVRGVWKIKDGQGCMTQTEPPGPTYCHPLEEHGPGDTWTNVDEATGTVVIITMTAGRD